MITGKISIRSSLLGATTSAIESNGNTPKFGWNRGGVAVLNRKPAISLELGKIRPKLLLMTNRKSHTRFRLVPTSTTLDDLEGHYALRFKTHASFGVHHKNLNENRPILSAARCRAMTVVSGSIRFMHIFAEVPWRRNVKRQLGNRKRRF